MSTIFRLANSSKNELEQLAELRWNFFLEEGGEPAMEQEQFNSACTRFLQDGIENNYWFCWVAISGTTILSTAFVQKISMVPKPSRVSDQYGYLTNVYTRPEYRNQGVGSDLQRHIVDWAKCEDLELLVVWPSDPSRVFYERLGFKSDKHIMQMVFRTEL